MNDDDIIAGRYRITELLCVMWNDDMAARFPDANHIDCRQEMRVAHNGYLPFDPVRCIDWHCNRCGQSTNSMGHHDCPDRPAA